MSLVSTLKKKNKKQLFTTPSHAGKIAILHKFYQWYRSDISEVDAYNPVEALKTAEKRAAEIYGVKSTSFLTNGSTSGVITAVLASVKKDETVLIWNMSHPCHRNACILAGAKIAEYELPYNIEWGVYEGLTADIAEKYIKKHKPAAIIVTSPSYEGLVSDIKEISLVCKKNGVALIVDEAHGALYPFSEKLPESAIKYADFVVQSLHKTAGGINPTALLHSNVDIDVKKYLNMITTTSPSYPMLATIEANINYLNSKKGKKKIDILISQIEELKNELANLEFK